jgi:ArsR family transcriptional regulator, arsenate/arsenite/antimonite-responsive transcriptional repressor
MRAFIKVMKALSDPSRTRIIKLLQHNDLCVCDITKRIGLAQPTISKHLKQLENAGLVVFRRSGKMVFYRIAADDQNPYAAALLNHLAHWLENGNGARNGELQTPGRTQPDVDYSETGPNRAQA